MNAAAVLRGAARAGEAAAAAAVERAGVAAAVRVVESGLEAEAEAGMVRLRGAGLLARAFGSRRRSADLRLMVLVRGER